MRQASPVLYTFSLADIQCRCQDLCAIPQSQGNTEATSFLEVSYKSGSDQPYNLHFEFQTAARHTRSQAFWQRPSTSQALFYSIILGSRPTR